MDILRFITAGNVDDGKSTLIGRLLYDTNNIKSDVLQSVTNDNEINPNLAHITDGLRAEREQGITIDVAYKYFTTKSRKYIITDAPGHFQYTKNLVTGASNTDLIIILIDANNGITEQTRRHSFVASFLKIPNVVIAINKMDAVNYGEQVFTSIKNDFSLIAEQLHLSTVSYVPMSALLGDNVSFQSNHMTWYEGKTLLQYLEECDSIIVKSNLLRFSVQHVINDGPDKAYAGKVLSGKLKVKDVVTIQPSKDFVIISKIVEGFTEVTEAQAGQNICVYLIGKECAKRGDIISHFAYAPKTSKHIEAIICWLDTISALKLGKEHILRINAMETTCKIVEVVYKVDVNTFDQYNDEKLIEVNQFAKVRMVTNHVLIFDSFAEVPEMGRGILIDLTTNYTSAAFTIV